MIKETIEFTKLIASDGMMLTDGENFAKEAYIGMGGFADVWREITESEYNAIVEEREKTFL